MLLRIVSYSLIRRKDTAFFDICKSQAILPKAGVSMTYILCQNFRHTFFATKSVRFHERFKKA